MIKRYVMLAVVLWACGGGGSEGSRPTDAELHAHADECTGWGSPDFCEIPCAVRDPSRDTVQQPLPGAGLCTAAYDDGRAWECSESAAFEYMGVLGCCAHHGAGTGDVFFAVCEGE